MKRTGILIYCLIFFNLLSAQSLNMQIKPLFGGKIGLFKEKLDTLQTEKTYGYQGGFAFRVSKGRAFIEPGFLFLRDYIHMSDTLVSQFKLLGLSDPALRYNSFEFPFVIGYKFVNTPLFKWYAAGGASMNVSIKSKLMDGKKTVIDIKAKRDLGLTNPRFSMRMGTGFDIAFFTMDLFYNLGLNSASATVYRTQTHSFEFNMGILF